jgi:ATP-dependent Clp endopeptidase proteolytic subunit ClpP
MSRKTWFHITNSAPGAATIEILDEIGMWGVSAKQFAAELKAAGPLASLTLRIDSPGGDCNDGFTIYDAIVATGADVIVEITGIAASMASVIMLAGKKIRIAENGRVMIHRVTGGAHGNADEMDAAAKVMKQFEDRIVGLYVARSGKDESEIRELMKAQMGTWFFGEEAIDAGFADELMRGQKASAFQPQWASKFTMLPAALFDTPQPPSPIAPIHPKNMKALIALASLVGITVKGDETEDQLTAAITAHKPAAKNVVIDFEDADVKAAFTARITDATQADKAKITALETELASIKALLTNGPAAAAGGNAPVQGAQGGTQQAKIMARAAFNTLPHAERNAFMAAGGKLED